MGIETKEVIDIERDVFRDIDVAIYVSQCFSIQRL